MGVIRLSRERGEGNERVEETMRGEVGRRGKERREEGRIEGRKGERRGGETAGGERRGNA